MSAQLRSATFWKRKDGSPRLIFYFQSGSGPAIEFFDEKGKSIRKDLLDPRVGLQIGRSIDGKIVTIQAS
jgi:hypothetical protein